MTDKPPPELASFSDFEMAVIMIAILCLVLLAGCDDPAPKAGAENMGDQSHFEECHKHDTYGAYIGTTPYCMVPIERMKEVVDVPLSDNDSWSTRPHLGWFCVSIDLGSGQCSSWHIP